MVSEIHKRIDCGRRPIPNYADLMAIEAQALRKRGINFCKL